MKILGYLQLLFVLMSPNVFATTTGIEVVESVPLETTLAVPGIRQTADVWLEMISSAQKSIDLEQFYINNQAGQSLDPILNALIAAAGRGVQVRFLVDLKFLTNYPDVPNQLSKLQNVQVKSIDFSSYGGIQHAKFFVVDQSHSFAGSANFDWLALSHIHEVGLKIDDDQIGAGLESVFSHDWQAGTVIGKAQFAIDFSDIQNSSVQNGATTGMQLVASPINDLPQGIPQSLSAITQLLASAKSSIKIQVYQYSTKGVKGTWTALDNEIRKAASRGVHVQLMVDAIALKTATPELKALSGTKNIEIRAVTIPQWSGGQIAYARLIHSKYFTVDSSSAWVGTENWSESYFTGCRNVGVILHEQIIANQLGQIFDQVWTSAYAARI